MKLKNLAFRILVAIFGVPLILVAIYKGGYLFLSLVLVINILSQYEFYKLSEKKSAYPLKLVGLSTGILVTLMFYFKGITSLCWILITGTIVILIIELFRNKSNATLNIATTILGIIYPTTLFSFLILIREFPKSADIPYSTGGLWVITVIITIWICDTAAFFIGSAIGRHKLYKRISPNKTVEGGIAGFLFSLITVYIFYLLYPDIFSKFFDYLMIGIIVGIFSLTGDLIESLFKRDADVKDSSTILPGHGGFLDRFDSPTFVAPLIYCYLILKYNSNILS